MILLLLALPLLVGLGGCSQGSGSDSPSRRASDSGGPSPGKPSPPVAKPAVDSLLALGEEIYFQGEYDSARALWSGVLRQARAAADTAAEGRSLTWLGLAAWKLGDYRLARRLGEEALALKLRSPHQGELFKSYNALGLVAWNEGRLGEASRLFEAALAAARQAGDAKGIAGTSANLALVRTELGALREARNGFLAAREAARIIGDPRIEGNALSNLGMLDVRLGDPSSAVPELTEARRLYRSINYPAGEQNALGQLGTAYAALGEPGRAIATLDSALALSRREGLRQEEADNLEALAELYRDAGDYRRALRLYERARAINTRLGLDLERGDDLRAEAEIHAELGDLPLARQNAARALEVHRAMGARGRELYDLLLLAELAYESGDGSDAESRLQEARTLARELDSGTGRLELALAEARVAHRAGDWRRVLSALASTGQDLARGGYDVAWEIHALRARAHVRLGALDSAAVAGRKALASVERVRRGYGSGELRVSYTAGRLAPYADLVGVLVRLGRVEEAFEVADAARGRALREHLASAGNVRMAARAAGTLAAGEELLRSIDALVTRLVAMEERPPSERDAGWDDTFRDLQVRLEDARAEYGELLVRAQERDPASTVLLGGARVRAREVMGALRKNEVLLEYLVSPDEVTLFAVEPAGVRTFRIDLTAANLTSRVRLAVDLVRKASAPGQHGTRLLEGLHDALVGPAIRAGVLARTTRLIVVPHGALSYLPFAALRDPLTGRYLAEQYSLMHLPSAAALPVLRERGGATLKADGERGRASTAEVFIPFPQQLPATRAEAAGVRRAWPRVRVRSAAGATEAELRRALGNGGLVHVASHGVMNAGNPLFSRIRLERGARAGPDGDGRLEVHELLGLRVTSPLVFLSGCETGLGGAWATEFDRSEDYATLAQAFLYAGARNVVATLWRIEDAGAAAFAQRFYHSLRRLPPPEALAQAQRDMMADDRYAAPYYWAAYELAGAGDLEWGSPE